MTQRIRSSFQSEVPRRTLWQPELDLQAAAINEPLTLAGRAWILGYMTVSLLAVAAACAVAGGGTATAELRLAAVVIGASQLPQDLRSVAGESTSRPVKPECAIGRREASDGSGTC